MDEIKVPLVINKLQSKEIYDYLASQGRIGLNELYLIQNDDDDLVVKNVNYDPELKKFTYTDADGNIFDVVTLAVLKNGLNLSEVASNGSYNSLINQPKINNVTLSGNKTTADLHISYNDLSNQPTIPTLTENYIASDTSKAMTGKATAEALGNYTIKTRRVTGTGALSGGGDLSQDRTITHNAAPTGLTPTASKVAVDSYGHVQLGSTIQPEEIGAIPITYNIVNSCANIDAHDYGTILIVGTQNESVSFSSVPPFGQRLRLYYANVTDNPITVTVDPANFNVATYFFFNGHILTSAYNYVVEAKSNLSMVIMMFQQTVEGTPEVFCFADVVAK